MLVLGRLGPRLVTGLTGPRLLPEVTGRVVTGREPGCGSLEEACMDRGGDGRNNQLDRCDQDICLLTCVKTIVSTLFEPYREILPRSIACLGHWAEGGVLMVGHGGALQGHGGALQSDDIH